PPPDLPQPALRPVRGVLRRAGAQAAHVTRGADTSAAAQRPIAARPEPDGSSTPRTPASCRLRLTQRVTLIMSGAWQLPQQSERTAGRAGGGWRSWPACARLFSKRAVLFGI